MKYKPQKMRSKIQKSYKILVLVGDSMSLRIGMAEEIKITGIDSKIDSFAASILFKPIILEPEYTTPALLAPGIIASI